MNKIVILGYLLCISFLTYAQGKDTLQPSGKLFETNTDEDVPFAIVDEVPIAPGCEKLSKDALRKCTQDHIIMYVNKKFNTGLVSTLGLDKERIKIYIRFVIDKEGIIKDVKAEGPYIELKEEGIRVIKLLPKMLPGKHKGKIIGVKYTMPITLLVG